MITYLYKRRSRTRSSKYLYILKDGRLWLDHGRCRVFNDGTIRVPISADNVYLSLLFREPVTEELNHVG